VDSFRADAERKAGSGLGNIIHGVDAIMTSDNLLVGFENG
jgi:hypothetical protein